MALAHAGFAIDGSGAFAAIVLCGVRRRRWDFCVAAGDWGSPSLAVPLHHDSRRVRLWWRRGRAAGAAFESAGGGQGFSDGQGTERDGRQTPRVAAVRRGVSFLRPGRGGAAPKARIWKMPPTNWN